MFFNVLTSHVQSSIELLYPINHYCWVGTFLVRNVQVGIAPAISHPTTCSVTDDVRLSNINI